MEIWKDILGYEGLYQVSNLGRIKSIARLSAQKHLLPEKILKQSSGANGYMKVNLCKDGKLFNGYIHRLAAQAFIPNPESKETVNHKDGNKNNNISENLEYLNQRENSTHYFNSKKTSSIYVGVDRVNSTKPFKARIVINNKLIHLGYFTNEYDAHLAYQAKLATI